VASTILSYVISHVIFAVIFAAAFSAGGVYLYCQVRKTRLSAPNHLELEAHYDAATGLLHVQEGGGGQLPPGSTIKLLRAPATPYRDGESFQFPELPQVTGQVAEKWVYTPEDVTPSFHRQTFDFGSPKALGRFESIGEALGYILDNNWDSAGNGSGDFQIGHLFYHTREKQSYCMTPDGLVALPTGRKKED